jgi:hypothetical protein
MSMTFQQPLNYPDDVILLGGMTHTIKNTELLIVVK